MFGLDGRLYVTGLLSNAIHVYSGSNGGSLGTVVAGLNGAESVLFNDAGNLLLISGPSNTVREFTDRWDHGPRTGAPQASYR